MSPSQPPAVHVLQLGDDGRHADWILYRLPKGTTLRFTLSERLQAFPIFLHTNYPETGQEFVRKRFRQVYLESTYKKLEKIGVGERHADLPLFLSGAFEFYFTYRAESGDIKRVDGCFVVEAQLSINGSPLPLDAVSMQTVLSKNLGKVADWEGRLRVSAESGFNFIHFTPLQELGQSNSSYSLANQLRLNPNIFDADNKVAEKQLTDIITKLEKEYGLLSLTDVVWNHTADNSPWLAQHPEVGYNLVNSPHLAAAYELDEALMRFSFNIANGHASNSRTGERLPADIKSEDDLRLITRTFEEDVLPHAKLWEYYVVDVDGAVADFKAKIEVRKPGELPQELAHLPLDKRFSERLAKLEKVSTKTEGKRWLDVDIDAAIALFYVYANGYDESDEQIRGRAAGEFQHALEVLNMPRYEAYNNDMAAAMSAVVNNAKYMRLDAHGPKVGPLSDRFPLAYTYFTRTGPSGACGSYNSSYGGNRSGPLDYSDMLEGIKREYIMANNGWIWGSSDPLKDFAAPGSNVYLRREVIIWGDCVKLRYGNKPEDCPFLWDFMKQYTLWTARHFHGLRIDNCHSTPRHVAQWLLDEARKVRPELYVMAELFTGSEGADNVFVNKLGISSLIREAMAAPDCNELGRLVHRYGGRPIGSFGPLGDPVVRPVGAHALFMDMTHDNEPPMQKRSVQDMLPNAAIVAMTACAIGSSRGYDELVPHYIDVVNEKRLYASWQSYPGSKNPHAAINESAGMIKARQMLNKLHVEMGHEGYSELYVDQVTSDVIFVTRHNPVTREAVTLIAFSAFHPHAEPHSHIPPLKVAGVVTSVALEASLDVLARRETAHLIKTPTQRARDHFTKDDEFINGVPGVYIPIQHDIAPSESKLCEVRAVVDPVEGPLQIVEVDSSLFRPGSVLIVRTQLTAEAKDALKVVQEFQGVSDPRLKEAVQGLSLEDLNPVLYRCDAEERDDNNGDGSYHIPGHGTLIYAGLQGLMTPLASIAHNNELGSAICDNLRRGNWLMDWSVSRLRRKPASQKLADWLDSQIAPLKKLPRFLIPCYFAPIVYAAYVASTERALAQMSDLAGKNDTFVQKMALTSVQLLTNLRSAPCRDPALPPQPTKAGDNGALDLSNSLAAGLPHFSHGFMRAWGRDTFIALRGLLLVTGRFDQARKLIIGFAGTARHGLLPNLLDGSRNPRFNCRDAVWFWLQAVQDYCTMAPEGLELLKVLIARRYPSDDPSHYTSSDIARYIYNGPAVAPQSLADLIQEIMQKHMNGIHFREWNAGTMLDEHMTDNGFNIDISVDRETGIEYGGNADNCGTWMDKMGGSAKAGNKGVPGTPRDGADVEIVGLQKSTLRWLAGLHKAGKFAHAGVQMDGSLLTYQAWNDKMQASFEKVFYIPEDPKDDHKYKIQHELVHRRGIYKDTDGSTHKFTDYQLRCNVGVAMAVAPEMFDRNNARRHIEITEQVILGPLGMRTLDPQDWNYRGDYDNSNDGTDPLVAHGRNYHQGPEWVWPVGYFLRSKLIFQTQTPDEATATYHDIARITSKHHEHINQSVWCGLHELTNSDGKDCRDSCPTQAWSTACLLDVVHDLAARL